MSTITSFTYSYNNIDNVEINKNFEYKTVYTDNDNNVWSSTYKNVMKNDNEIHESFNKLYKSNMDEIKEQIGNSVNQSNWKIKEFDNGIEEKSYTENYDKYPYYNYYVDNALHNINNDVVKNNDITINNGNNMPKIKND
jgi:hypothetical protein